MPNTPKPPGSIYPFQAGLGFFLMFIGIFGLVIRNIYSTNPVHWLVGGSVIALIGFLLWRYRNHHLIQDLKIFILKLFNRHDRQPGEDGPEPFDNNDFDYDPSQFGDDHPEDAPGTNDKKTQSEPPKSKPHSQRKTKPTKQPTTAKDNKQLEYVRKLEDLRDNPKSSETERNKATRLLEFHAKTFKRKRGRHS
ncbi:MAG: hypothetical protein JKY44_04620 [Flavobacteriaceae bacterium]|nr:hypothetical protein [Flavobacteriaceae bacterium]